MTFRLYPDPAVRALHVSRAPSTRVDVAFEPLSSPPPAELALDFTATMFLRVAVLTGSAPPQLSLRAGAGPLVTVDEQPRPIFAEAGQHGFVGQVWATTDSDDSSVITVGLNGADPVPWSLGILNTDDGADHDYTWVVADNLADTRQTWTEPPTTKFDISPFGVFPGQGLVDLYLAADPGADTVYVQRIFDNSAMVFSQGAVPRTLPLPGPAHQMAVDPQTHALWFSDLMGQLTVIAGGTQTVVTGAAGAAGVAIDATRRTCYAPIFDKSQVFVISADAPHDVRLPVPVGDLPIAAAVDPSSGVVCVANSGSDTISIFREGELPRTATVGKSPNAIAVAAGGHAAYVSNTGEPTLSIVDLQKLETTTVALTGTHSPSETTSFHLQGIALDPDRYALYMVTGSTKTEAPQVMDTRTGLITALTFPAGATLTHPGAVAVDRSKHVAYFVYDKSCYRVVAST